MFPLELVKSFQAPTIAETQVAVYQRNGQKCFFDFNTGTPDCRDINGVEHVDTLNEGGLTPVHDLAADAQIQRHFTQIKGAVGEQVKQFDSGKLGEICKIAVIQFFTRNVIIRRMAVWHFAIFKFEVVPVLDPAEGTELAVVQFQLGCALDDI